MPLRPLELLPGFFNNPTVHAFQGLTVDIVVAAIEANHPALNTQNDGWAA